MREDSWGRCSRNVAGVLTASHENCSDQQFHYAAAPPTAVHAETLTQRSDNVAESQVN